MNCKPGDLAIIIGHHPAHPELTGMIVEVLYLAPRPGPFKLPNGVPNQPARENDWVIKFTRPVPLRWVTVKKPNIYAVCPDSKLKPLPGEIEPIADPAPPVELPHEVTA